MKAGAQMNTEHRTHLAVNPAVPFQTIRNTARLTGLSAYHLRRGCKDGTIPHIRVGVEYRINLPRLMDRLNAESEGGNEHEI